MLFRQLRHRPVTGSHVRPRSGSTLPVQSQGMHSLVYERKNIRDENSTTTLPTFDGFCVLLVPIHSCLLSTQKTREKASCLKQSIATNTVQKDLLTFNVQKLSFNIVHTHTYTHTHIHTHTHIYI